ncbi:MAG: hypothetical protein ACJAUP_003184 [Cellvibrionaceae bacterium]|jgi:hypothetical protein
MNAKQTAATLLDQLDDNASWGEVKGTIMTVYKRETGDAKADAIAALFLCAAFVTACIFWVSSQ